MLTQRTQAGQAHSGSVGRRRLPAGALPLLLLAPARCGLLPGCVSTQVRQVEDEAGKPLAISRHRVVLVEPDIELYARRRRRHGRAAQGLDRSRAAELPRRRAPTAGSARHHAEARLLPAQGRRPGKPPAPAAPAEPGGLDQHPELRPARQRCATSTASSTGPSARAWRTLREATGADYALFTYVRDSYTSGGRAAMRVIGFLLLGGDIGGGRRSAWPRWSTCAPARWSGTTCCSTRPATCATKPARTKPPATCSRGSGNEAALSRRCCSRPPLRRACSPAAPRSNRCAPTRPVRAGRGHRRRRTLVRDGAAEEELRARRMRVRDPALNAYVTRSPAARRRATARTCASTSWTCPPSTRAWRPTAR